MKRATHALRAHLGDPAAMAAYLRARLLGDTDTAPPPIDALRGEAPGDLLAALLGDAALSAAQRTWFWDALLALAAEHWRDGATEPFAQAALVGFLARACRAPAPPVPGAAATLPFLPTEAAGFDWPDPARVRIGSHALFWLRAWHARPAAAFWTANLRAIATTAPPGPDRALALLRAIDGVPALDLDDWRLVLDDALTAPRFPTGELRTTLLLQWRRAAADPAAEARALANLDAALSAQPPARQATDAWSGVQALVRELADLPWTPAARGYLDRLLATHAPSVLRHA